MPPAHIPRVPDVSTFVTPARKLTHAGSTGERYANGRRREGVLEGTDARDPRPNGARRASSSHDVFVVEPSSTVGERGRCSDARPPYKYENGWRPESLRDSGAGFIVFSGREPSLDLEARVVEKRRKR